VPLHCATSWFVSFRTPYYVQSDSHGYGLERKEERCREQSRDESEAGVHGQGRHRDGGRHPQADGQAGCADERPDLAGDVAGQPGDEPDPRQADVSDAHAHAAQQQLPGEHTGRQASGLDQHRQRQQPGSHCPVVLTQFPDVTCNEDGQEGERGDGERQPGRTSPGHAVRRRT
jgi:hypothetical protein